MKQKIYYLIVLLLIQLNVVIAQQNPKQDKYWRYRQKLVSRLLRYGVLDVPDKDLERNLPYPIGGYSLPADEVNSSLGANAPRESQCDLWFGDTPMQLGMYIGVLATEYQLLKSSNQDYSMTLRELLRALQAFDRIDKWAEAKQQLRGSGYGNPSNNGITMRDDVTFGFGKSHFYLEQNMQYKSSYKDNTEVNDNGDNFISKDHYAYLLAGWALVVKCIHRDEVVDGVNIVNLAKDQVDRSIGKFSRDGFIMRHPSHSPIGGLEANMITMSLGYADAGARVHQGYFHKNLAMGYDARYSNRTTFLAGNFWRQTASLAVELAPNNYVSSYINFLAAVASDYAFGLEPVVAFKMPFVCGVRLWRPRVDFCQKEWYIYRFSPPTTLSPALGLGSILQLGIPMVPMPFRLPNLMVNYTGNTLSLKASISRTYLQPLLHQYLFNSGNLFLTRDVYRIILDNAPENGTYFRAYRHFTDDGVLGWRTNNRFEKPEYALWGNDRNNVTGEFNGLDYMLLYNLYHLVNGSEDNYGPYEAGFKPFYDKNWPAGNYTVTAKSGIYFAGETNKIMAWSNVKCLAPSVNITEHFYTEPYSTFYANADASGFGAGRVASDSTPAYQPDPATLPIDTNALIEQYNTEYINELTAMANDSMGLVQAAVNASNQLAYIPECDFLAQNQDYIDFEVKEKKSLFEDELTTFPNPATTQLNLAFNLQNNGYAKVKVMNNNGSVIIDTEYPNLQAGLQQLTLDIASLNTGLYYILVETSEKVYNGKISKI